MKKYILVLFSLGILSCILSCEKEMMDYEGTDSIYFDVQRGVPWLDSTLWARYYHTTFNFIKTKEPQSIVYLKVAFSGEIKDYDRPFQIKVLQDSTDAVEGKHFTIERDWIMPAGANSAYLILKVNQDEDYLQGPRKIMLKLLSNEYFDTNMTFTKLNGRYEVTEDEKLYNADPRLHTIELVYEAARPASWRGIDNPKTEDNPEPSETGLYGALTVKKYLLMLRVTGFTDEDFADMPGPKRTIIAQTMSKYLEDQFEKGEPVLENDGRLMWFMYVKKWKSYQYEW